MFYAHFVLNKKGPLARVWLAAHWDKKLTKANIFETNIEASVQMIMSPQTKLALRTTGHLLVGVARIYWRKTKYLQADCNDALLRMRLTFRPGSIDLPANLRVASHDAITLQEDFFDFDAVFDVNAMDFDNPLGTTFDQANTKRPEEITLREEVSSHRLPRLEMDDDFGASYNDCIPPPPMDLAELRRQVAEMPSISALSAQLDAAFGITPANTVLVTPKSVGLSQADSGFGSPPFRVSIDDQDYDGDISGVELLDDSFEEDDPSISGWDGNGASLTLALFDGNTSTTANRRIEEIAEEPMFVEPAPTAVEVNDVAVTADAACNKVVATVQAAPTDHRTANMTNDQEQTTLVAAGADEFVLAPVDATSVGEPARTRGNRRRRLVVDGVTMIPSLTIKANLGNVDAIIRPLDLAPPTKRLMTCKEFSSIDKIFTSPGCHSASSRLLKIYQRSLHVRGDDDDNFDETSRLAREKVDESAVSELELDRQQTSAMVDTFEKSARKPQRTSNTDVSNASAVQALDINISGTSSTPASGAGDSSVKKRTRRNAPSLQSLLEIPPTIPDNEYQPVVTESSNNELVPPSDSNEAMLEELNDFEMMERRGRANAAEMHEVVRRTLRRANSDGSTKFSAVVPPGRVSRKHAASQFHALLVLKKQRVIDVSQAEPFADIIIRRGPDFSTKS